MTYKTSFSQSKLFNKCNRWWFYSYIKKVPTVQDMCYANAGKTIHSILEMYYNGQTDLDVLKEEFVKQWKKYKLDISKIKLKNDAYWGMILKGIELNLSLTSTEFKILFDDVVAYIDGLNSQSDEICDFKSSTKSKDTDVEYVLQLKFYSYLYHRKFDRLPKKASVYYLKYSGTKGFLDYIPTTDDMLEIEDWHMSTRKKMQEIRTSGKIPDKCAVCDYWCPYKNLCADSDEGVVKFTLHIQGNYIRLDGPITNVIDAQLTKKFSYELKNAHFIKKAKPMAKTRIEFWNLRSRSLPIGFKDQLVKTLTDYAKWKKKELALDIDDLRNFDDTEVKMPDSFLNGITLRDYQDESVTKFFRKEVGALQLATGAGKCFAKDTEIMMCDSSIKKVQDIKIGDILMGDDGTPRNVLSLNNGKEEMFEIQQIKGINYTVNKSHILSLKSSITRYGYDKNKIVDIEVNNYLSLNKTRKHILKGVKPDLLSFPSIDVKIDPYFLGLWLGDGSSNSIEICNPDIEIQEHMKKYAKQLDLNFTTYEDKRNKNSNVYAINSGNGCKPNILYKLFKKYNLINNKHIPQDFKINSKENRLGLLAGLIDTDGHLHHNCFEIVQKNKKLANDIVFIAKSLGFGVNIAKKIGTIKSINFKGLYYRINISGNTDNIPTKVIRKQATKRKQKKRQTLTGIKVELKGIDKYYGFVIDGNKRFLLSDFTIVHNTEVATECVRRASCKTLFVVDKIELLRQTKKRMEESLGIPVGQVGGGEEDIQDVTIATMQTLTKNITKYATYLSTVKFAIFDECFVSQTYILTENGTITLGRLFLMYQKNEQLPKVLTLNEKTKNYEYKRILKVLQKENENLLKINIGRRNIKVTHNHLFLTNKGWKKAKDLTTDDLLYSYKIEENKNDNDMKCLNLDQLQIIYGSFLGDGCLDFLPSKNYRIKFTHGENQKSYLDWKLNSFDLKRQHNIKSGYTGKTIYRGVTKSFNIGNKFTKNDSCPIWLLDKINEKGIAIWFMDDGSLCKRGNISIIHSNSFDYDEHIKFKNMFKKRFNIDTEIKISKNKYYYLYFKRVESIKLHKLIDKYIHPNLNHKKIFDVKFESNWNKEFLNYGYVKIVSIEQIKNKYSKGGSQTKPYVYDLSVEDNHNYIVTSKNKKNGIVVHNCHHCASRSVWKISKYLVNTKYRLGLSATVKRDDGNDMMITAVVGDVFYSVDSQTLIDKALLVRPTVTFIEKYMPKDKIAITEQLCKTGLLNETPNYANFYNGFISENQWRNDVIKSLVDRYPNKKILILTKLIEHGKMLKELISDSEHLYGDTPKEERKKMFDDFKLGTKNILISTLSIFAEGVDIPTLDIVINAGANRGDIKTIQVLGRVLRTMSGKTRAYYYDFMDESRFFRLASLARKKILRDEGHEIIMKEPPKSLTIIEATKFSAIEMEHRKTGIIKKVKYDTDKEELIYISYRNKTHVMRMFSGLGISVAILDKLKKQNVEKIIFKFEQATNIFEYYLATVEDFYNSSKERAYDLDKQKFLSFDELKANMVELGEGISL